MERFVLDEVSLLQEKIFNKCNQLYDIEVKLFVPFFLLFIK